MVLGALVHLRYHDHEHLYVCVDVSLTFSFKEELMARRSSDFYQCKYQMEGHQYHFHERMNEQFEY